MSDNVDVLLALRGDLKAFLKCVKEALDARSPGHKQIRVAHKRIATLQDLQAGRIERNRHSEELREKTPKPSERRRLGNIIYQTKLDIEESESEIGVLTAGIASLGEQNGEEPIPEKLIALYNFLHPDPSDE